MYTFKNEEISDLYKEVHGRRPSYEWFVLWESYTDSFKQFVWDNLIAVLEFTPN